MTMTFLLRRPLRGWTHRLPSATFGGFVKRGRHSKPILAWRVLSLLAGRVGR